ncbi:thiamine phosphate synthase [Bartonella tamiae]|uniref:Thiamine phosphate synthase/TenI domain-containing protein n=1 Tax=Bartonella tamiae Th239 TaxID=1094558 RepID=J0QZY8_9HYPH|nr:thiamine phosphate synthase [Bartonella tamiae]EJF91746.1 hypothetical protein ME5_00125 [Bartonella tamiae Th239]EJF92586.1 hypothetical protein MEG_01756 [Bartonella tamiae Th307]
MSKDQKTIQPRLILTLNVRRSIDKKLLASLLEQGKFASVILYEQNCDEFFLQKKAEEYIEMIQSKNLAALIANDSRIAGRVKADGVHIETKGDDLRLILESKHNTMIKGVGNIRDRHSAMEIGEYEPDYLFFGKLGADQKPDPHPRNLTLGQWWAHLMEIPAIVQAGTEIESLNQVLETKAEFIAIENLLFQSETPENTLNALHTKMQHWHENFEDIVE